MTPHEMAILQLMAAAEQGGFDPVAELRESGPPISVDLRTIRDGRVVAAMRTRIEDGVWRYEIPARPEGKRAYSWRTRYLGELRKITRDDLSVLDHWLAQIPGTGRAPVPMPPRRPQDVPGWMKCGYWELRLGIPVGRPH